MTDFNVALRQTRSGESFLDVPGIGLLTKKEAIALAVELVFLADGHLCGSQEDSLMRVNKNSVFLKAYAEFACGEGVVPC